MRSINAMMKLSEGSLQNMNYIRIKIFLIWTLGFTMNLFSEDILWPVMKELQELGTETVIIVIILISMVILLFIVIGLMYQVRLVKDFVEIH